VHPRLYPRLRGVDVILSVILSVVDGDTDAQTFPERQTFSERLTVPGRWHVGAVVLAALAGSYPAAYLDQPLTRLPVYLAVLAAVEAGLWWAGYRVVIAVDGTSFSAAGSSVPLSRIAGVTLVDDIRTVLVPNTCAVTRPWIRGGVLINMNGADGMTQPDWVLSSRRGEQLAAAARTTTRHEGQS
jgi:hypothetical protein